MNAPGLDRIQLAMQQRDSVAVVALVGVRQLRLKLTIFTIAVDNVFQRRFAQRRGLLVNPGQRPVAGKGHAACVAADLAF